MNISEVLDRMRSTGASMRLLLFLATGFFTVQIFEPRSLITYAFSGHMLWPLLIFMVTFLGITETVINDVFSSNWTWARLQEWRYAMLFICACFYGSVLYLCSAKDASWAAYPIFAMFCFFILLHMFLDIRARFKR